MENNFIKNSISFILENNISQDMLSYDAKISELVNRLVKLKDYKGNFNEVLTVFVENENKIKAVLTAQDMNQILDLLQKVENFNESIKTLNLETKFPLKYNVSRTAVIEDVVRVLASGLTDVVLVTGEENQYLGKITRSGLVKYIRNSINA